MLRSQMAWGPLGVLGGGGNCWGELRARSLQGRRFQQPLTCPKIWLILCTSVLDGAYERTTRTSPIS